jgi:hypothetical protein
MTTTTGTTTTGTTMTTRRTTMTDHHARLYASAIAILVLFLTWAVVAARPWPAESATQDPRLAALERREAQLRKKSVKVKRAVERRFAVHQVRLRKRQAEIAAIRGANAAAAAPAPAASAPSVSVVSLPPVTSTRSS